MGCIIEPAINVYVKEEYIRRITIANDVAQIIQFDVIDGVFARPGNFNDTEIVRGSLTRQKIDLHFMVMDIEGELKRWVKINPFRICIHVEHPGDLNKYFGILEENNIKKCLAIAPFTPIEKIQPYIKRIDSILIMSVNPGKNGQAFIPDTINRIKIIHAKYSQLKIGVDGGVRPEHLRGLSMAGVNNIVIGSSMFSGNEEENYRIYCEIVAAGQ